MACECLRVHIVVIHQAFNTSASPGRVAESSGRPDINSSSRCRSSRVNVVFKALASPPFRPRSQHDFWLCKYAPRPASFPVGSINTPSSNRRTTRMSVRFASTVRQPTQVRCGTCLGGLLGFPTMMFRCRLPRHRRRACVSSDPPLHLGPRRTDIRPISYLFYSSIS